MSGLYWFYINGASNPWNAYQYHLITIGFFQTLTFTISFNSSITFQVGLHGFICNDLVGEGGLVDTEVAF